MIAYFDLDDTLCRYKKALLRGLNDLRGSNESMIVEYPEEMFARKSVVLCRESFWTSLELDLEVKMLYDAIKYLGFKTHILTAGPIRYPEAWSGKKKWVDKYFPDVDLTITRDKSLLMGDILVDDYPKYFKGWLISNPKSIVIYPYNNHCVANITRAYRYDNYDESWSKIEKIIRRRFGNKLLH